MADEIILDGGIAHVVTGDLADPTEIDALLAKARSVGHIDILVINAGASGGSSDWSTTEADAWATTY